MRLEDYVVKDGWQQVLSLLPDDLEESARRDKAIIRLRKIRDAATLLRIILIYSLVRVSSRGTSWWLESCGLPNLSSISVLQRLRWSAYWLSGLLAQMLDEQVQRPEIALEGRNLLIQDATMLSRPHSKGTDRRVHLTFGLAPYRIVAIELTNDTGGETFVRMDVEEGSIVLGDRGYAHRRGIWHVVSHGADVLVRVNWQNIPFVDRDGNAFNVTEHLKNTRGDVLEWPVSTRAEEVEGIPSVSGRLVAKRKDSKSAAKERKRVIRQARKKHREPDPRSLIAADFTLVFTTLSEQEASSEQVMELFRYRWQIEITFKRLKGILNLDNLPNCTDELLDTIILGRLIGAMLIQKIASKAGAFPPCASARSEASGKCRPGLEDDTDCNSDGGARHRLAFSMA
jgi:hypothetical protein